MKKLLKISDWVLLGLAGFFDFLEEIKDPFGLIENYYQNFYGYVPLRFRKLRSYHFIWRSLKTGDIKKKVIKGKVYLELTSAGWEKIKRKFPLFILRNKKWDQVFRLVIYDIEEENKKIRDIFRQKIKQLGFGMVQKSVWVTPYDFLQDFQEFLKNHHLENKVILIETKNFYVGDLKEFAKKVWSLEKINKGYKEIYNALLEYKSLNKKRDRYKNLNTLRKKIIFLYLEDPFLPYEFLPDDWMGEKVRELVKELKIF